MFPEIIKGSEPMRFLPLYFDLTAGPVLLVGAGAQAMAKLRILQAAGAQVRWYVRSRHEAGACGSRSFAWSNCASGCRRTSDFIGAIALVASVDKDTDEALAKRARAMNLPVNIVDRPELSTFIFPAIVDRGDVVVAVGTSGTSPVLARRLRERIEEIAAGADRRLCRASWAVIANASTRCVTKVFRPALSGKR